MTDFRVIPSHPAYRAGSDGSILGSKGKPLRQFAGTGGYLRFTTYQAGKWQQVSTHVMVCESFHGCRPSPEHQAAHRNGVRTDNRASNLRWITGAENEADKATHGTKMQGESHHQHKLTADEVREIRANYMIPGADMARRYGVSQTTISKIRHRLTWRHI